MINLLGKDVDFFLHIVINGHNVNYYKRFIQLYITFIFEPFFVEIAFRKVWSFFTKMVIMLRIIGGPSDVLF